MTSKTLIPDNIWQRVKSYFPYILFAIVLAEISGYSVIGRLIKAETILYFPKLVLTAIFHGLCGLWNWLLITIGPMMFGLFPLAGICAWAVVLLLKELMLEDEDIINRSREKFGGYFLQLFNGSMMGMSRFDADKKLCQMLAYSANNRPETIKRLFRRSKLYSEHWDHPLVATHNGPTLSYEDLVTRLALNEDLPSDRAFYWLEVVTELAVTFGFAGTILALMATMGNMTTNLSQSEMIDVLLKKSSAAFGSTVTGLFISVSAYIATVIFNRYFPDFLNTPKIDEQILFNAFVKEKINTKQPFQADHQ